MRKHLPWILIVAIFGLYAASTLRPRKDKGEYHLQSFASLPVVLNGRVQPLDSVARNALIMIRGNSSVPLEGNGAGGQWGDLQELHKQGALPLTERKFYQFSRRPQKLKPIEWLLETATKPEQADQRFIFSVDHPDLKSELKLAGKGLERSGLAYFNYAQLLPHREKIVADARVAGDKEAQTRSTYEKAVFRLANTMVVYERLKNSFQPEGSHNFEQELEDFAANVKTLRTTARETGSTESVDEGLVAQVTQSFREFHAMAALGYPFAVPPPSGSHDRELWQTIGGSLTNYVATQATSYHPAVTHYAALLTAFGHGKADDFNAELAGYRNWLAKEDFGIELSKGSSELFFNNYAPFKTSIVIYLVAFLLAAFSMFVPWPSLRHGAAGLIGLALVIHTSGLIFRMVLEGRPPVTNLYSSAIFIGWGTVVLGVIVERFWKNGLGSFVASLIGVITLIIAHNLSLDGDTMEMLQAVLDTNFWLATHVVVITLGYSAMFLAGFLGIVYLVLGVFTPKLNEKVGSSGAGVTVGKAIGKIVYGIICFATLFSFVGTVLGGIWADQSWGRFWGWDPKENGALLIVLWCAIILHARWGGLVRDKGIMVLAIFGNVITAFSWFGTNMLGVGLHSYGFMDAAFRWLMIFNATQVLAMLLGAIPDRHWRSGQGGPSGGTPTPNAPVTTARPKAA
jgi:cytochrome c-type biogenesis protein CcsB